jgi:toxin ParE1/3/4
MKLRYAPRAKADIAEIHAYLADRNAKAATAVIRRLKAAAELLAQFPGVGRATDIPGVRALPAASFPYLIYYTQASREIVILHIRHASRDLPGRADL